jgi:protease I
MENILSGKKICILVASGFAEEQFSNIQKILNKTGAKFITLSPENGLVHGWFENTWGHYFPVDAPIATAMGSDFDAILIPGGARGIEKLKNNLHTKRILRHFFDAQKPIVAIAESIELLTLCDHLNGLEISAPAQLVQPVKTAGAIVSGQDVTIDEHLLTFARIDTDMVWIETITQHLAEDRSALRQQAA